MNNNLSFSLLNTSKPTKTLILDLCEVKHTGMNQDVRNIQK